MYYIEEWTKEKCDKYDYMLAAFSGVSAGFIDIFLVGAPREGALGDWSDTQVDNMVMKFSKMTGWNPKVGKENNISSAIGFLEKKFPVNYDQANGAAVGGAFNMGAKNHHFKSLSHSPDIVGLFFSILDQFQGKSSFISGGQLIRIDTESQNLGLYGGTLPAKIFCGFCNWIGHVMSDIAGSSGGRGAMTGRGSGLSIPLMELFQFCNLGSFNVSEDGNTLAQVMVKVFQEGYDFRHGIAMSIPILINELIVRVIWVIKARFYNKKEWKDCIPSKKHGNLRIMLIVSNTTLCSMDGIDALVRSGGNTVAFILRLNLIAWVRLVILVFREIRIRYGNKTQYALKAFLAEVGGILTSNERKLINEYNERIAVFDGNMDKMLTEYINIVNKEYELLHAELSGTFDDSLKIEEQLTHGQNFARLCGVKEDEIIKNNKDLEKFLFD